MATNSRTESTPGSLRGNGKRFAWHGGIGGRTTPSRQQFPHHFTLHVGQPEVAAGEAVRQAFVIEAQ